MGSSGFQEKSATVCRGAALVCAALTCGLILASPSAIAQERWMPLEEQALATLPTPQGDTAIASADMLCAEQRWSFQMDLKGDMEAGNSKIVLSVDGSEFATEAESPAAGQFKIPVPLEALEPLKRGLRLSFSFDGKGTAALGTPVFSLIGSRAAIAAVEAVCSRPDMSAYRNVTFTPFSSYMALAKRLRENDISQFRIATSSEPELTAAMAEFGEGRRVLFTKLCGSSWYFGRSGCNITGFGPDRGENEWRVVYDTEGVLLHIDDSSEEYGWPDLVTLPLRPLGEASTWRWQGSRYQLLAH